jgi:hypothetical protein
MNEPEPTAPLLPILLTWAIVLIPLGWGVYQSVMKSLPLIDGSAR